MPLLIAMMALSVLTALAATLVLGTMTETAVAASYREGVETFYAAEAAVEFVIQDLAAAPDWEGIAAGEQVSSFVDGPPLGVRQVGAVLFDLAAATDDIVGATSGYDDDREYRIYANGRLSDMLPGAATASPYYVVVDRRGRRHRHRKAVDTQRRGERIRTHRQPPFDHADGDPW